MAGEPRADRNVVTTAPRGTCAKSHGVTIPVVGSGVVLSGLRFLLPRKFFLQLLNTSHLFFYPWVNLGEFLARVPGFGAGRVFRCA